MDLLDDGTTFANNDTATATSPTAGMSLDSIDLMSQGSFASRADAPPPQSTLQQISEEVNAPAAAAAIVNGVGTIYQVEFDVNHVGRNKPASKRMATWKYGIHPAQEHEATLVWSTHSGKYTISVDGNDVFANVAKGSVLDYKWKWNHRAGCIAGDDSDEEEGVAMRIVACRKPPTRSSKDFRCYEFVIQGKIFRELPVNDGGVMGGSGFENEEQFYDGKLMSILDIVEPGWRSTGFT